MSCHALCCAMHAIKTILNYFRGHAKTGNVPQGVNGAMQIMKVVCACVRAPYTQHYADVCMCPEHMWQPPGNTWECPAITHCRRRGACSAAYNNRACPPVPFQYSYAYGWIPAEGVGAEQRRVPQLDAQIMRNAASQPPKHTRHNPPTHHQCMLGIMLHMHLGLCVCMYA